MNFLSQTKINFFEKIEDITHDFFYGYGFPIAVSIIALFSYITKLSFIGLGIFSACACFLLIFYKDLTPFLPLLTNFLFLLNGKEFYSNNIPTLLLIVSPVLPCLIFHIIFYTKKFKLGKLFLPLVLVTLAFALGGINSSYIYEYLRGVITTVTVGPLLIIINLFIINYVKPCRNVNLKDYYSFTMTVAGIVVAVELFLNSANTYPLLTSIYMPLGWGNPNGGATFLLVALFCSLYLAFEKKYKDKIIFTVCFFLLFSGILASGSDGVLLLAVGFTGLSFIFMFFRNNKKNVIEFFIFFFTVFLILATVILSLSYFKVIGNVFDRFTSGKIISTSGREPFYAKAITLFIRNPIFGVGFGFYDTELLPYLTGEGRIFYFHSTLFQIMASLGIFGIIVYFFYYVRRFEILMKKNSTFSLFAIIAFSAFTFYGLIDCVEFAATPCMITTTVLISVCQILSSDNYYDKKLPLENFFYKIP